MKTQAPSSTKSFAVANPIPSVPPVMTAVLPSSLLGIVSLLCCPSWKLPNSENLSGGSFRVIRSQEDILHKFFKRSRCSVLRRTRFLRSEDSRVNGPEHLDVHGGFLRRKTHLCQCLLHLVVRKLFVT